MKHEEYNQLELLFNKLKTVLGHKCCIVTGPNEGFSIAIYDNETGDLKACETNGSIEECVKQISGSG
jgi:hypothetical protein